MASDRPKGSTSEAGLLALEGRIASGGIAHVIGDVRTMGEESLGPARFHIHFRFRPSHGGTRCGLALRCFAIPPFRVGSPPPEEWPSTPFPHYPAHNMMAQGKQQNSWDSPKFTISVVGEEFPFCVGDGAEQGWANGSNPC